MLTYGRWAVLGAAIVLIQLTGACAQELFHDGGSTRRSRTYHVVHYKLVVSFDEHEKKVFGTTSIRCTPLLENIDSLVLDAETLDVSAVSLSTGLRLGYSNRSPELIIHLDRGYSPGDTLTVVVDYSCSPHKGLYFIQPDRANPLRRRQIWTQGEDMDNHCWFPCYDYPNDKATSEVIATVRDNYTLLSNGKLVSERHDKNAGTRTFHWRQTKPHPSYLIMLAAGEYAIVQDRYRDIPLQYYVYPQDTGKALLSFGCTPRAMKFFEEKMGYPFPWDKYAQIVIEDFMWGGMENTTAVTMNEATVVDARARLDFPEDAVVAHELAHQWWGDLVTCRDWTDLWLHEGFATYCENLFKEHEEGKDALAYEMHKGAESIRIIDQSLGRKPIISRDSYATNLYTRGAWVLHMLRNILGEKAFWRGLRLFLRRHEFANADTHELSLAIEDATGQNLQWFFDQWVYKAGYPHLVVHKLWSEETDTLSLSITQTQVIDSLTGIFKVPLRIHYATVHANKDTLVWLTRHHQDVGIPLSEEPLMVIVDKGEHLLKDIDFERSPAELMYQLLHADDAVDRVIAAKELHRSDDDSLVVAALLRSAVHDPFWAVRKEATVALGDVSAPGVGDSLMVVARDRDSRVRSAAIRGLANFRREDVIRFVESIAGRDSSYVVLAACVGTLADLDSTRGYDAARRYVDMNSYRDLVRRTALSVLARERDTLALPYAVRYAAPGNSLEVRSLAVGILGEMGRGDTVARGEVLRLAGDGMPAVRKAAAKILGEWGGESAREMLEHRQLVENDEDVLRAIRKALERIHG